MCGIIGYVGNQKALPFLLNGLKNLEYRGYDSCGIALLEKGELTVIKREGKVDKLVQKTSNLQTSAKIGIGHTRWATHGKPLQRNAHPHTDCKEKISVVHNGIIENFEQLKKQLVSKGHQFQSDTDTEIIPHLIEEKLKKKYDLFWAVRQAVKELIGAYGIVVLSEDFPGQLIAARNSSPLILGFGDDSNFVASDQPALVNWTKDLASLKDGQVAKITKESVEIKNLSGQSERYQELFVGKDFSGVSKNGYDHFMLKEIHEQSETVENGLRGRFDQKKGIKLGGIEGQIRKIVDAEYLPIFACGTSMYASLIGKVYFQDFASLPVLVEDATDLVGSRFPWKQGQPAVFASQSGETADVLSVLRQGNKANICPFGLVNVVGSTIARETKAGIYARAGYEIGVAATKSFTNQVLAYLLWSLLVGEEKGLLGEKKKKKLFKEIKTIPQLIEKTLDNEEKIKNIAGEMKDCEKVFFLGRQKGMALSMEAALKVKEISYLPAEAIGAGALKHGPLALVDHKTVLFFIAPDDKQFRKNLNSINEAAARGGRIFVLTNRVEDFRDNKITTIKIPDCGENISVFPAAVSLQLLAYWIARELDRPIDKPRNLAKSVTVE
jgi:glucosamine--fructose-6-phosphate aminotransferase (isomerizing)